MKNYRSILMIILLITTVGCKEQEKKSKDALPQKADTLPPITKTDVQRVVQEFNNAMINPSVQLLENLCAEDLTYGHSNGLIQNKAAFIDDLVNGPYDFKSVTSPELTIDISEETAVARFIFLATAIKEEKPVEIRLGCIQIFQRQDNGNWKLLARQGYKLPESVNKN